ncbi:MAG: hypothetical protein KAJ63_08865 [Methyloprofundus sp.]|nr:hypothetical protein [Methyloprofundus sp.]
MPNTSDHKIYSQSSSQLWLAWISAIIWNALTWFAIIKGGDNILRAFEESPVFYFFALFPVIGIWIIISAIRQTLATSKFGKTPVILDPSPGQIGGHCAGYMTFPGAEREAKQAKLSLSCIQSYTYRDGQGKSSQREKVLWQDQITLKPEKYGRKKMRLNFAFNPPAHLPESGTKSDDYHFWRLHIHIPLPGIDFDRTFVLPMEKVNEQTLAAHEPHKAPSSTVIEHRDTAAGSIPEIKKTPTGTQFHYGYGRSKGMAAAIMSFSLILAVFGYFFFADFLDFLPTTMGLMTLYISLIALGLFLLGVFLLANSLTVEAGLKGVRKQQRFFGYLLEKLIATSDIANIITEQNASSSSGNTTRVWYKLQLVTHDGKHIEVGDTLEGQSYADEVTQQMMAALGSSWQASTVDITHKKNKSPIPIWLRWLGKLLSYSFFIAFLYDLNTMFPGMTEFFGQFLP